MSERHIELSAGLEAVHTSAAFVEQRASKQALHAIVQERPETDRAALFVSPASQQDYRPSTG